MRRVTFSRNFTLSLSRTCQCYCKYCAFATHRAHLYSPEEVEKLLDDAGRRGAKELLVLTGEKPEVNAEVAARLADYGHADFISYVVWACERALERGMLPHTNVGVCTRDELARLRQLTDSSIRPWDAVTWRSRASSSRVQTPTLVCGSIPRSRARSQAQTTYEMKSACP